MKAACTAGTAPICKMTGRPQVKIIIMITTTTIIIIIIIIINNNKNFIEISLENLFTNLHTFHYNNKNNDNNNNNFF